MERNPNHRAFRALADDLIAEARVEEGTMMGHHCLRSTEGGGFVATVERSSGSLVAKLPAARVEELIESGIGVQFAPAGRVFREWVAVSADQVDRWEALIGESIDFVSNP